jgi:hypothetical protein
VDAAVLGRQRRVLLVDPHRGRVFAGTAGRRALPIHGPGGLCKRRRAGRVGGALALSRSLTRSLCRSQGAGPSRAPAAGDVVTSRSARRPRPRARAAHRAGCARASPSPPVPPPRGHRAATWLLSPLGGPRLVGNLDARLVLFLKDISALCLQTAGAAATRVTFSVEI